MQSAQLKRCSRMRLIHYKWLNPWSCIYWAETILRWASQINEPLSNDAFVTLSRKGHHIGISVSLCSCLAPQCQITPLNEVGLGMQWGTQWFWTPSARRVLCGSMLSPNEAEKSVFQAFVKIETRFSGRFLLYWCMLFRWMPKWSKRFCT